MYVTCACTCPPAPARLHLPACLCCACADRPSAPFLLSSPPCLLQTLAGTFSDKASLLVDLNERALAMRTGGQLV